MKMEQIVILVVLLIFSLGCGMAAANSAILPETNATATPFRTDSESPRFPAEYVVTVDVLNVRRLPSVYAPVDDWLVKDKVITVLGEHTDFDGIVWYNIGHNEWVSACCVVEVTK